MKYFLIDTENVPPAEWIGQIRDIDEETKIILFATDNSPKLTIFELRRLVDVFRYIKVVRCSKGNNALDFQLSSYLGYMLFCAMDGDRFLIVSKDKGYTPLESFWGEQDSTYRKNILVRRIDPEEMSRFSDEREAGNAEKAELAEIPTELGVVFVPQTELKTAEKRQQPAAPPTKAAKKTKKAEKTDFANEIRTSAKLNTLSEDEIQKLKAIFRSTDPNKSDALRKSIVKAFGKKRGKEIYEKTAPARYALHGFALR